MSQKKAYISVPYCKDCQGCCDADAEVMGFVCGYEMIHQILEQKIILPKAKGIKILNIPSKILDDASKFYRMYPIDNFLRHMTNPTAEGVFQLLVTDSGKCNFLGDKGCVLGDVKPLVCGIFPFMLYKLQLHYNYCCPGADNMECDCEIRESLGILLSQFLINSEKHKEDYGRELKEIQKKYQLPIENYQGCYTNQKQK